MKFELVERTDWAVTPSADAWNAPDATPGERGSASTEQGVTPVTPVERMTDHSASRSRAVSQVIASLQAARSRLHARIAERERELAETGQMTGELPEGFRADRFTPAHEDVR
jgi:hypothetical protein